MGHAKKHPCADCEGCPLYFDGKYVPSKWTGSDVVFIGEAPGADEVRAQEPFVGSSGQLLARAIRAVGKDPEAYSKTNVVSCQPPGNYLEGYSAAIAHCTPRLMAELEAEGGDKLVALGKIATEIVLGDLAERPAEAALPPSARRGRWFVADDTSLLAGRQILSEYHPAYVLRQPGEMSGFKKGIARVFLDAPTSLLIEPPVIELRSFEEIKERLDRVPDGTWTAFDLETNQIQFYSTKTNPADEILLLAMSWNAKDGYVIPGDLLYDDPRVAPYLSSFFDRIKTVAHNGKFDVVFLKTAGVRAHVDFDTMLAHYVLEETAAHGLKEIAQDEYGIPNYEAMIIRQYLRSSNDEYSKIPWEQLSLYAAWDVVVTRALKERFEKRLRARPAFREYYQHVATRDEVRDASAYEWPFMNLLMPAQHFLSDVEFRGIGVDQKYLVRASAAMQKELDEQVAYMRDMCGDPGFNPNAHMQVARVLYDQRGLPTPRKLATALGRRIQKTKSKNPERSTDKGVLDAIIEVTNDAFAIEMKHYRRVAKIKSAYMDNMLEYVDLDGLVHADFRVMGTEVGRLAVRDPALQTVPRASDRYGAAIKAAFIAQPYSDDELLGYSRGGVIAQGPWQDFGVCVDWPTDLTRGSPGAESVLIVADYNQAEMCAAAHYSNDPFLIGVYEEGRDLHDEATYAMFGTPEDIAEERGLSLNDAKVIWKELRVQVKMFNFAYLYGGNENSFAQDRGIPLAQARAFVHRYEQNMQQLSQWKRDQYKFALKYGYVVTVHGRRRTFPELQGLTAETMYRTENRQLLDDVRKASVHAVVAGTASDLCLLSANKLSVLGLEIVLLVHDSILIRCPRFLVPHLEQIVPGVMVGTASEWLPRVKWRVDFKTMKRWATPPEDLLEPVAA